ncbi:hybrid sensor histidine kinase/response regulator [Mycetohabitans endofungorum]|uniref:Virulence sensor protein BvgS n=1 Tax=Mycetohabitans endofungorum TaxID=417203 RepID=A0A2P5K7A5_9BURK|nr:response regulator [Mycetohabitans endofungorum]PPB81950.1 PAS/PAC sensor hybrid histidine kinase [Mycetohabitans endofungorum]
MTPASHRVDSSPGVLSADGQPAACALIIDDDEGLLSLARRALTRAGFDVVTLTGTQAARAWLDSRGQERWPDVLIVDYVLGTAETGLDFLRSLRMQGTMLPAILCTGFADETRVIEALRSGVADVVPKTSDYLDYLPQAIERVLAQKRAQREIAEAELVRARELHYRTLAEAIPQLVWTALPDGRIDFASKQLLSYTGMDAPSLLGHVWPDVLVHPDDRERTVQRWSDALRDSSDYDVEHRLRAADGAWRWFKTRAAPLLDGAGRVSKWFGTSTDIDDQKLAAQEREHLLANERQARSEAERASRLKDEFVATLSHELRTPLNAIVGWAQLLLRDASDPARVEKGLQVIHRNARLQSQMIDDLLDMSRIMAGKVGLNVQRVELVDVITDVIATVQLAADAKELRVMPVLGAPAVVNGDPARLQQIIWNLLTNAIKFTPRRGRVAVTLTSGDGEARLVVSDTGCGIREAFLPHVFERFRQEDASTTRQFGGLGLGLSIVKELVEMHGGHITAASEGEQRGATFTVTLPTVTTGADTRRGAVAPISAQPDTALPRLDGVHVLVVEDEADARELVHRVLEERGAQVSAVASVRDALQAFDDGTPDVVISDLGMPEEDGFAFIAQLREREAARGGMTPAAALSGRVRGDDRRRALMAGFQTHLAKPVDPADLLLAIASLVGRAPPAVSA